MLLAGKWHILGETPFIQLASSLPNHQTCKNTLASPQVAPNYDPLASQWRQWRCQQAHKHTMYYIMFFLSNMCNFSSEIRLRSFGKVQKRNQITLNLYVSSHSLSDWWKDNWKRRNGTYFSEFWRGGALETGFLQLRSKQQEKLSFPTVCWQKSKTRPPHCKEVANKQEKVCFRTSQRGGVSFCPEAPVHRKGNLHIWLPILEFCNTLGLK